MKKLAPLLAVLAFGAPAQAVEFNAGNQMLNVPVRTFVDLRFGQVIRQTRDLSCGAAALGTLLKFYYGIDVTEQQIIDTGFAVGDSEKIARDGFSMLELKRVAEKFGLVAGGFRIPDVANLASLKVPVIGLVSVRGYNHFVVIKGVSDGRVYIADPAFGNRSTPLETFDSTWNKVILVVVNPKEAPKNTFAFEGTPAAPMRNTMSVMQSMITPLLPNPNRF